MLFSGEREEILTEGEEKREKLFTWEREGKRELPIETEERGKRGKEKYNRVREYLSRDREQYLRRGQMDRDIPETTIGEGVSISGQITFERLLRVDGHFEGTLHSKGRLIVGPAGSLNSSALTLSSAWIEGELKVEELVILGPLVLTETAVVRGKVRAHTLIVRQGAQIQGEIIICREGEEKKKEDSHCVEAKSSPLSSLSS